MVGGKAREIVHGGLALRHVVVTPSGFGQKTRAVAFKLPAAWAKDAGIQPGDMVLCSRKGNSFTFTIVDKRVILSLLKATEEEE